MNLLKLNALDSEDLNILSAHLQDAIIKIGDMRYLEKDKQFVMVLNRFDWSAAHASKSNNKSFIRHRTGVQFGRVLNVKQSQVMVTDDEAVIDLLSIEFEPTDAPSGIIQLVFAGGGAIRLEVECIEARLSDLGQTWDTKNIPDHEQ